MTHQYFVYILSSANRTTYIGVTNNIDRRLQEHRNKVVEGYTSKYNVDSLVYYESFNDIKQAIAREKEIKKWRGEKKTALIESKNPDWLDLSENWEKLRIYFFKDFSLRLLLLRRGKLRSK